MSSKPHCGHLQNIRPRNGIIAVEVHDHHGNELTMTHISVWDDGAQNTIPRINISVEPSPICGMLDIVERKEWARAGTGVRCHLAPCHNGDHEYLP